MSKIDYILLVPIIFGIVYGLYRGFFKEIVVILCVIVALFVSRYFGEFIANLLSTALDWNINITKPISFIIIFVGTVVGLKILAGVFTRISKAMTLSWLNRILGGVLGGLKWLIFTSIFLNITSFFYQTTHKEDRNRLAQSKLYEPIRKSLDVVVPLLDFDSFTEITKNDKK